MVASSMGWTTGMNEQAYKKRLKTVFWRQTIKSLEWHTKGLLKTVYRMDNRKPLEVFLDFSWNMQSLGLLSSGAGRVNSWGRENEVRVAKQCKLLGRRKGDRKERTVSRYISEVQQPEHSDLPKMPFVSKRK